MNGTRVPLHLTVFSISAHSGLQKFPTKFPFRFPIWRLHLRGQNIFHTGASNRWHLPSPKLKTWPLLKCPLVRGPKGYVSPLWPCHFPEAAESPGLRATCHMTQSLHSRAPRLVRPTAGRLELTPLCHCSGRPHAQVWNPTTQWGCIDSAGSHPRGITQVIRHHFLFVSLQLCEDWSVQQGSRMLWCLWL